MAQANGAQRYRFRLDEVAFDKRCFDRPGRTPRGVYATN